MMFLRILMLCFLLFVGFLPGFAQDNPLRMDRRQYNQLDRLRIKYPGEGTIFPADHHMSRKKISQFILSLPVDSMSRQDLDAVSYFVNENPEWFTDTAFLNDYRQAREENGYFSPEKRKPILRYFYKYPAEMFFVRQKDLFLSVNPILHWNYGQQVDGNKHVFENRKGVWVRAGVENKIFIDTKIEELQLSRPDYIDRYIARYHSIPELTFYTTYKTDIIPDLRGYDVFDAEAYLTIPVVKYAFAQFGYGRQFIGQGIQSLLLSDFTGNYLHLRLQLEIWKLKYQFMISEVAAVSAQQLRGDQLLPKKYMAMHMLQIRLWNRAHLGLCESVVFNREHQLEWHYLMPVIFFRSIERAVGSPDNILIGADFGWDIGRKYKFYSQFILDEFRASELFGGHQWWANKWGLQTGVHAFDVLNIQNLNVTLEYNTVRPYTYSHRDSLATYAHYNSPMAHPLGANFREYIARLDYQPSKKWSFFGLIHHHRQGMNEDGIDYGGDIRPPNLRGTRPGEYGIYTLQGRIQNVTGLQGGISYMLWHNAYLDFNAGLRQEDGNRNGWATFGFRLNTGRSGANIF